MSDFIECLVSPDGKQRVAIRYDVNMDMCVENFYDPLGVVYAPKDHGVHDKGEGFIRGAEYMTPDEVMSEYLEDYGGFITPLYKYEHSGVCYDITPFVCGFDSGCVGYIHADKARILGWYDSEDAITPELLKDVEERIKHEVVMLSYIANGRVFIVSHEKREDTCASCGKEGDWGYEDGIGGILPTSWRESTSDILRHHAVEHFVVDLKGWEENDE